VPSNLSYGVGFTLRNAIVGKSDTRRDVVFLKEASGEIVGYWSTEN
jgi:hypothetical protein